MLEEARLRSFNEGPQVITVVTGWSCQGEILRQGQPGFPGERVHVVANRDQVPEKCSESPDYGRLAGIGPRSSNRRILPVRVRLELHVGRLGLAARSAAQRAFSLTFSITQRDGPSGVAEAA
jgi:hypothetical protein